MGKLTIRPYVYALALIAMFILGIQLQANGFIDDILNYQEDIIYLSGHMLELS